MGGGTAAALLGAGKVGGKINYGKTKVYLRDGVLPTDILLRVNLKPGDQNAIDDRQIGVYSSKREPRGGATLRSSYFRDPCRPVRGR